MIPLMTNNLTVTEGRPKKWLSSVRNENQSFKNGTFRCWVSVDSVCLDIVLDMENDDNLSKVRKPELP